MSHDGKEHGSEVSELLPHIAHHVDDLCVIRLALHRHCTLRQQVDERRVQYFRNRSPSKQLQPKSFLNTRHA